MLKLKKMLSDPKFWVAFGGLGGLVSAALLGADEGEVSALMEALGALFS